MDKNYLLNRSKFVSWDNVDSNYLDITCSVPQGSILGPTLFIIYVNDICNVSQLLKCIMFADDTNLIYSHDSANEVQSVLNNELEKLN